MIKRSHKNINKRVKIIGHGNFNGRTGIVKSFRGDDSKDNPWVNVYVDSIGSVWPFQGSDLKIIK